MELKQYLNVYLMKMEVCLLIVPYGIETIADTDGMFVIRYF